MPNELIQCIECRSSFEPYPPNGVYEGLCPSCRKAHPTWGSREDKLYKELGSPPPPGTD